MLPKIHKNKTQVPGRPIFSGVDCPREKILRLLDVILQPYVANIRSYIRDTGDILQKIQNIEFNFEDWIFSMDVTSLYTNNPHDEVIQAISELLNSKRKKSFPKNENVIRLLAMILRTIIFLFLKNIFFRSMAQPLDLG